MNSLAGRVAIVTGAAHPEGMGFASCRKLAAAGATVVVTDRPQDDGRLGGIEARADEISQLGGQALAVPVDITQRQQIDACVEHTMARYGRIDILFNNAGTPVGVGDFLTMTDAQWDASYAVNLKGMADFCQAVLPAMIDHGGGAIVNNASTSGLGAVPEMAAYTATKFAVVGLTKALAVEFGSRGVRVNAVCPGMVWTQMAAVEVEHSRNRDESFEEARSRLASPDVVPLGRWAQADEVADAVVYLCRDEATYISGVALPVAGGMAPGL